MMLASLKNQLQIMSVNKMFIFKPTFSNYPKVFQEYDFLKPILNSMIVASLSTLFSLIMGLPAAYSIARYRQEKLSFIILMVRFIPSMTFLIPWFIIFSKIGLTDNYISLILSHMVIALPFIIWVMMPYFETIPKDLEEAATIDGSSHIGMFVKIVLPLSGPGIITVSILSFIFSWNNFIMAMILAGGKTKTVPLAIFNFVSDANIDWGGLMAASVTITLPIIIFSLFTQRFIVKGLTAGAVKS
jgi:multiple sugar transport system permease protein